MVKIKEIKISIHRKYTKNFQSYGYRIGVMLDIDKDDPRDGYYQGKAFLNERIKEEDLVIKNIMDKRVAEKQLGHKELSFVPEGKLFVKGVVGKGVVEKELGGDGGGDDEWILIDVKQIIRVSDKAVLVELFGDRGDVWIPKSCVGESGKLDLMEKGVKIMLTVKKWFLKKSGLV